MMTVGMITQLTTDKGPLPKQITARPPVRSEPLLAAYDRFKHLDSVLEMVSDSDGTEQTNPFHMTARDLWRAIKASLGHTANAGGHRQVPAKGDHE